MATNLQRRCVLSVNASSWHNPAVDAAGGGHPPSVGTGLKAGKPGHASARVWWPRRLTGQILRRKNGHAAASPPRRRCATTLPVAAATPRPPPQPPSLRMPTQHGGRAVHHRRHRRDAPLAPAPPPPAKDPRAGRGKQPRPSTGALPARLQSDAGTDTPTPARRPAGRPREKGPTIGMRAWRLPHARSSAGGGVRLLPPPRSFLRAPLTHRSRHRAPLRHRSPPARFAAQHPVAPVDICGGGVTQEPRGAAAEGSVDGGSGTTPLPPSPPKATHDESGVAPAPPPPPSPPLSPALPPVLSRTLPTAPARGAAASGRRQRRPPQQL